MITYKNGVVQEDLKFLYESSVDWSALKNKSVLVTGATGMLATYFSFMLMYLNENHDYNIKITLLARSKEKTAAIFGDESANLKFLIQDVCDELKYHGNVDYIIHAAGAASPYYINNEPVSIIKANTLGTFNVLELAKNAATSKVLFTSTREVYGKIDDKAVVTEADMGTVDPLDARSCYPESKRMAETILKSYSVQYKVPFNALRIAHSYGPGMQTQNDGRVMADFINDAVNKRDIALNSSGKAERAFCYITDAIDAMFRVLISGNDNEAYNIANETEPIPIVELARIIQDIAGNGKSVTTADDSAPKQGYTNYERRELGTAKVAILGWAPRVSLRKGLENTLRSING